MADRSWNLQETQNKVLLENNTFSSTVEGWATTASSSTVSRHTGTNRLQFTTTNTAAVTATKTYTTYQGKKYRLSIDLNTTSEATLLITGYSGSIISSSVIVTTGASSQQIDFVADATSTIVKIQINAGAGSKTIYADNVKLEELKGDLNGYRFGFNGKEGDDEVSGDGNSYDFGARIYNPRLGRWLSVDPLQSEYPSLSTYNYCANNPIYFIDPDGKKILIHYIDENGKSQAYEYGSKQAVPDNKYVQETVKALNYASQSKTGKKEVDVAVNSNRTLNIHEITDESEKQQGPGVLIVIPTEEGSADPIVKDNNGNPVTPDLLSWSPYTKSEVLTDDGEGTGNTQSAALMLVHEIKHWNGSVKNLWGSLRRLLTKDAKYDNREERKAIKTETKVANELGENTRTNHKGKIHKSTGSTDSAPVTPSKKTKRGGM